MAKSLKASSAQERLRLRLEGPEVVSLDAAEQPLLVRCESGIAWVTGDDGADVVLRAGEERGFGRGQRVVLQALRGPAVVSSVTFHRPC